MSGGYFDYKQYQINQSADELQSYIDRLPENEYQEFSTETINKFEECVQILRKAHVMLHRIDWLISGDDCEEIFHKRLDQDLQNIRK